MSKSGIVGLMSGLTVVVLTMIVVALVNLPEAEGASAAGSASKAECHAVQISQDQGYEITRKVVRDVCAAGRTN